MSDAVCKNCCHFTPADEIEGKLWPGAGHCSRWVQHYGADPTKMKPNDCWVESDEGWANWVGPEFGCVLFGKKATLLNSPA